MISNDFTCSLRTHTLARFSHIVYTVGLVSTLSYIRSSACFRRISRSILLVLALGTAAGCDAKANGKNTASNKALPALTRQELRDLFLSGVVEEITAIQAIAREGTNAYSKARQYYFDGEGAAQHQQRAAEFSRKETERQTLFTNAKQDIARARESTLEAAQANREFAEQNGLSLFKGTKPAAISSDVCVVRELKGPWGDTYRSFAMEDEASVFTTALTQQCFNGLDIRRAEIRAEIKRFLGEAYETFLNDPVFTKAERDAHLAPGSDFNKAVGYFFDAIANNRVGTITKRGSNVVLAADASTADKSKASVGHFWAEYETLVALKTYMDSNNDICNPAAAASFTGTNLASGDTGYDDCVTAAKNQNIEIVRGEDIAPISHCVMDVSLFGDCEVNDSNFLSTEEKTAASGASLKPRGTGLRAPISS